MVTPLQQRIYTFIKDYLGQNGYSPSLTEIAQGIGISPKSISLVSRSIHSLVAAGQLQFQAKGYRKLSLKSDTTAQLPVAGTISTKPASTGTIQTPQAINLGTLLAKPDHFLLTVEGDSMQDAGILHGDLVVCQPADKAKEGDWVIAQVDGAPATLNRISYQIAERITLIPTYTACKPKAYLPHRVQVRGVFVGLIRLAG